MAPPHATDGSATAAAASGSSSKPSTNVASASTTTATTTTTTATNPSLVLPPSGPTTTTNATEQHGTTTTTTTTTTTKTETKQQPTTTTDDNNDAGEPIAARMKLLDVRLKPASAILDACMGEFTSPGSHEVCLAKAGGTIEVYKIVQANNTHDNDDDNDNTTVLFKFQCRTETKSVLRACRALRFPGASHDVVAVSADGGCCSVLQFLNSVPKIIHCVTFGKTACRRSVPGQYLAADPKGRAVWLAAVEKRKLVYVLNRDANGKPTIASPLEAHKSRTITFAICAVDNGYDNPILATLELQYPDLEDTTTNTNTTNTTTSTTTTTSHKQLALYELDLGLNHVSRTWATETVPSTACCLAAVPGGADGPGGVLVGAENVMVYYPTQNNDDTQRIVCPIPRRALHAIHTSGSNTSTTNSTTTNKSTGILIQSITLHRQKKFKFFALAQSELGDVYKVTLTLSDTNKNTVVGMQIAVLDTLPTANALCVSKLGMLFCASEFGHHYLYQFMSIDLPNAPTCTSTGSTTTDKMMTTTFTPTSLLQNLQKIVTLENPSPTIQVMVGELAGNEVSPQIYTLTGRGPVSALSILRHGAAVTELALTELPGVPGGIFTVADNKHDSSNNHGNDQYIVVSFADATLVLSVGETVEEVGKESGLLTNAPTLACSALGHDGALCQVHPAGVRQIQKGQVKQWHCPGLKRIECASANEAQVIIALAGGEVIYFDFDPTTGNLTESVKKEMGADVCSLSVGSIPKGKSRSLFAAVGCRDQTVRIVSLEPGKILQQRSSTALKSRPHSVILQQQQQQSTGSDTSTTSTAMDDLTLVIGLDDGSCLRASIDPVTGSIGASPTRRFLGARPVSVSKISLEHQTATLLLSSRPWISRRDNASGKHIVAPLSFAPLDHGCSFRSEAVREGIVATAGKTLRILSVDSSMGAFGGGAGDDEAFNTNKIPLRYTPRQMTLMSVPIAAGPGDAGTNAPTRRKLALVTVESDYNEYGLEEKKVMGFDPEGGKGKTKESSGGGDAMDMDMDEGSDDDDEEDNNNAKNKKDNGDDEDDEEDDDEKEARTTPVRGPVPPGPGHWGSCVRLLDPSNNCASLDCLEMGRNEAALCCASVRFHSKGGEPLLAVGTVTGMTLQPMKQEASHIVLYRIMNGERFQLLHRTSVDDGPVLALAHFQGRLLVGIGKSLRLYEMGKRQLLRKCELRRMPTCVKTIQTVGDRAFVGDMLQSVQIVRYDSLSNRLVLVASDPSPRPIVCQELLDWNTVAVGDKFGNLSILRLPRGADVYAIDRTGQRALWDSSATPKLELLCQYYIGEVVTGMTRSSLVAGGAESLIYVTVSGRIGALVPFTSRADVEFYTKLEGALRVEAPRPTGRDPLQYRSYYAPVMHVVDGDLCDAFNLLGHEQQSKIAEELDMTVGEIMKKLEDTRNGLL